MDDLHQGVIDLTRTNPWHGQCWIFVFGMRSLMQGERRQTGSSEDKQLASRVCSYHQMCKM